jgi:hypothetical protein
MGKNTMSQTATAAARLWGRCSVKENRERPGEESTWESTLTYVYLKKKIIIIKK